MGKTTACYRTLRESAVTKVILNALKLLSIMGPICTVLQMSIMIYKHLFTLVHLQLDARRQVQICFYHRFLRLMDSQTVGAGFSIFKILFVNIGYIHRFRKLILFYHYHRFREGQLLLFL